VQTSSPNSHWWFARLGLVVAVILVFGWTVRFDLLAFDDQFHISGNPHLNPLTASGLLGIWKVAYGALYIPVSYSFWAGVVGIARGTGLPEAGALHGASVLLHAGVVLCVLQLLRRLEFTVWPAAFGAALFALHPVQVEAVAWVSEARGVLATLLGLLGFLALLRWQSFGWITFTVMLTLAMLAKPSVAPLVLMVALVEVFWRGRPWREVSLQLLPATLAAGALLWITTTLQPAAGPGFMPTTLGQRGVVAIDALGHALIRLVVPIGLTPDYGRTPAFVLGTGMPWLLPALSVLVAVLALAAMSALGVRKAWVLAAMFLAGMLPVLGLVPFDHQLISTTTDRYLYLPMLAVAAAMALLLRVVPRAVWVVPGPLLACAILSLSQAHAWRDDRVLWEHAVSAVPTAAGARNNLGSKLFEAGDLERALSQFDSAIRLRPEFALARANRGFVRLEQGELRLARADLEQATRDAPDSARATEGLGMLALREENYPAAAAYLARATSRRPADSALWSNYGAALLRSNDPGQARRALEQSLRLNPKQAEAWHNLGLACRMLGDDNAAIAAWQTSAETGAALPETRYALASALLAAGRRDQARTQLEALLKTRPTDSRAWNDLGVIAIADNDVDAAVRHFRQAILSDPNSPSIEENLRKALQLQSRKPSTRPGG
jgi:protein O-mannosyl-transferase